MRRIICLIVLMVYSYSLVFAQGNIIAKKIIPTVVLIVMEDDNGQMLGLGSGFFVSKDIIATNFHVIENASRGYVKLVNQQSKVNIEGVVGIDKSNDLCLLKVNAENSFLELGNFKNVETGETIYVAGNPRGLEGTFSQGIVSSVRTMNDTKLLQITAPISPGSSGGPVVNNQGLVVGVSVATFKDGQSLNFAVPVTYLFDLLKKRTTLTSLKSVSKRENNTLNKIIGDRINNGVIGQQFKWTHCNCSYSFTILNKLRNDVKNVVVYLIFYDLDGFLYDTKIFNIKEVIPGGLPMRIKEHCDNELFKNTTHPKGCGGVDNSFDINLLPKKFEIRVVNFEVIE